MNGGFCSLIAFLVFTLSGVLEILKSSNLSGLILKKENNLEGFCLWPHLFLFEVKVISETKILVEICCFWESRVRLCGEKIVGSDYFLERWNLLKVLLKIEAQVLTFW